MGRLKCRFKLAWQNYRVGDVITPPASLRDWLLQNGYVEVLDTGRIGAPLTRAAEVAKAKVRESGRRPG